MAPLFKPGDFLKVRVPKQPPYGYGLSQIGCYDGVEMPWNVSDGYDALPCHVGYLNDGEVVIFVENVRSKSRVKVLSRLGIVWLLHVYLQREDE